MKNKKILAMAMALSMSATLMACGNTADNKAATEPTESVEEVETAEGTTELNEPAPAETDEATETADENTEVTEGLETEDASGIYDLEFAYLPENFIENYNDEKSDLRTVEYVAEKNPASKIQLQISDNEERFLELVTVPEEAEDIEINGEPAKYWEEGSFNYVVMTKGPNHIYARSTLERDETIKVVEEIK